MKRLAPGRIAKSVDRREDTAFVLTLIRRLREDRALALFLAYNRLNWITTRLEFADDNDTERGIRNALRRSRGLSV